MLMVIENRRKHGKHEWEMDGELGAVYLATCDNRDLYYRYDQVKDRYVIDTKYGKERTDYLTIDLTEFGRIAGGRHQFLVDKATELMNIHKEECEILEAVSH